VYMDIFGVGAMWEPDTMTTMTNTSMTLSNVIVSNNTAGGQGPGALLATCAMRRLAFLRDEASRRGHSMA
jgi:hypothetical protein